MYGWSSYLQECDTRWEVVDIAAQKVLVGGALAEGGEKGFATTLEFALTERLDMPLGCTHAGPLL